LRNRLRAPVTLALTLAFGWSLFTAGAAAAVDAPKVVIIVGPTGSLTDTYRSQGNALANTATAAGAQVVKVYSPNATWANVKAAVEGASIVVYLGHGNGFPSPYSTTEDPTRVNGWGLNRTTQNGDSDNWSTTMVYCGEEALLGTLTSADAAQWNYCGGSTGNDGINPAPGWVMIYNSACYAPGAGETGGATETQARERVRNYSYPALALGAGAYFATDFYASPLIDRILRYPDMGFGEIVTYGNGYSADAQRHFAHADVAGAEVWIQKTYAMGRSDYWYAFAGDPTRTPAGGTAPLPGTPRVVSTTPANGKRFVATSVDPKAFFDRPVVGLSASSFGLYDSFGFRVPAALKWSADLNRAMLVPSRPLVTKEWYTVRLSDAVTSTSGMPLVPFEWRFRTKVDAGDGVSATWTTARQLVIGRGTHTAYGFDAEGGMLEALTVTLPADATALTTTRRPIIRQAGIWFYLVDGPWAGYWMRQSNVLHLADEAAPGAEPGVATFGEPRPLLIKKGTHTGYQFDAEGAVTASKPSTVKANVTASTSAAAVVSNQSGTWFLVADGRWAGHWLRASDVVKLKG
jgi:hypothetical protein